MVTAEGLRPVKEVGMYGKTAVMELFRPKVSVLGMGGGSLQPLRAPVTLSPSLPSCRGRARICFSS